MKKPPGDDHVTDREQAAYDLAAELELHPSNVGNVVILPQRDDNLATVEEDPVTPDEMRLTYVGEMLGFLGNVLGLAGDHCHALAWRYDRRVALRARRRGRR